MIIFHQHNIPSLLEHLRLQHRLDLRAQQLMAMRMRAGFKRSLPPMYNMLEEEGEADPPDDDDDVGYITAVSTLPLGGRYHKEPPVHLVGGGRSHSRPSREAPVENLAMNPGTLRRFLFRGS